MISQGCYLLLRRALPQFRDGTYHGLLARIVLNLSLHLIKNVFYYKTIHKVELILSISESTDFNRWVFNLVYSTISESYDLFAISCSFDGI